jgi:hypothetical protein
VTPFRQRPPAGWCRVFALLGSGDTCSETCHSVSVDTAAEIGAGLKLRRRDSQLIRPEHPKGGAGVLWQKGKAGLKQAHEKQWVGQGCVAEPKQG